MGQFEKLLEYVKGLNKNTSEQGTWFENFMKYVFLTSPVYQELYEKVWTWTEFPYNGGRHDFVPQISRKFVWKNHTGDGVSVWMVRRYFN